jgi:glyoxylase-like metal-dependent hydrolase (beta-lactamase superfamily II)
MITETGRTFLSDATSGEALWQRDSSEEVAPGLACLQQPIVNLYFHGEPGAGDRSWVLIDAGLLFTEDGIVEAAAKRFGEGSRPVAIILTHGHFDHVGALPHLAIRWDVPVYAHELERPYLSGQSSYPPPDPAVGGGAMSFFSRFYPRGPIDLGDRLQTLPPDGHVPGMSGWRWLHTPGHSPGHVSLFRDSDRVLIAGDAFVTTKQESAVGALLQWDVRVRRPPAYFTPDWQAARRSVEKLAQLLPETAVTGHGLPMRGERLRRELEALAYDWQNQAVPSWGRYIREPAQTSARGVVWVPPPIVDPQLLAVAAVGVVGLGLWRLHATRSRSPW